METEAKDWNEGAEDSYESWKAAETKDEQEYYKDKAEDKEHTRNVDHALGITFFAVGGASIITGIVLFILMPHHIPKEPKRAPGLFPSFTSSLQLSPILGPETVGAGLTYRF